MKLSFLISILVAAVPNVAATGTTMLRGDASSNRFLQADGSKGGGQLKVPDCDCSLFCADGFQNRCNCYIARDTTEKGTPMVLDPELINTTCFCDDENESDKDACEKAFNEYNGDADLCLQNGVVSDPPTTNQLTQKNFLWYDCQVTVDTQEGGDRN